MSVWEILAHAMVRLKTTRLGVVCLVWIYKPDAVSASLRVLRFLARSTEPGLESAVVAVEMLLAAYLNRVFVVSTTYFAA